MKTSLVALLLASCVMPGSSTGGSTGPSPTGGGGGPAGGGPATGGGGGGGSLAALANVTNPGGPATRAADGSIVPPGGALSTEPRDCSAKNDHCTRGTRWCSGIGGATGYVACFEFEGKWYSWLDRKELHGSAAWLTMPANDDEIYETMVLVFVPPDPAWEIVLPRSEQESLGDGRWQTVMIDSIEKATGTFRVSTDTYNISSTRMVVKEPPPLKMP